MGTVKLSDALNDSANITKTIKAGGEAPIQYVDTVWDDLKFAFTQTKQGSNLKPDFDYTNVGLLFDVNQPDEIIYLIAQFPHKRRTGAIVRPHIHWQQSNATPPTWMMQYKWINNGEAIPVSWTTLTGNAQVFTYTSGNMAQISSFPSITPPAGDNVSSYMLVKLYRDDTAGVASVLAFEFDIHYQIDSAGSANEYSKVIQ